VSALAQRNRNGVNAPSTVERAPLNRKSHDDDACNTSAVPRFLISAVRTDSRNSTKGARVPAKACEVAPASSGVLQSCAVDVVDEMGDDGLTAHGIAGLNADFAHVFLT
jgi:hypothetical protein